MLKVGLTGGIGAGKSEVSRLLVSYGAVLIDSDRIAREVVAPPTPRRPPAVAGLRPGRPAPPPARAGGGARGPRHHDVLDGPRLAR
ncbi:dephospho-CoA kinase, partial [Streptomyces bacillaris]